MQVKGALKAKFTWFLVNTLYTYKFDSGAKPAHFWLMLATTPATNVPWPNPKFKIVHELLS